MRLRTIAFAATILLAMAAFNASFAESPVVSEQGFDWIFFAIVGIPFLLGFVVLFMPDLLEGAIRQRSGRTPPR